MGKINLNLSRKQYPNYFKVICRQTGILHPHKRFEQNQDVHKMEIPKPNPMHTKQAKSYKITVFKNNQIMSSSTLLFKTLLKLAEEAKYQNKPKPNQAKQTPHDNMCLEISLLSNSTPNLHSQLNFSQTEQELTLFSPRHK